MAVSRRFVPHLFGALVAVVAACKDPHPTTGSLQIEIDGLPAGGAGKVVVTGPDRFSQIVTTTTTLSGLQPGEYRTRIDSVTHENDRYGAAVVLDTFEVVAGQTDELTATYSLASGSINFTVTGVPPGASADIRLVAPSMNITATGSGIVHGLPPGKIYIHTDTFSTMQGDRLGSPKIKDSVTLTASATPVPVTVNYTTVSGTLTLTVNGMPSSLPQSQQPITVTGPSGYLLRTTGTGTLRGLVPGSYTVNAAKASGTCPAVYKTTTSAQTVAITAGQTNSVTVNYTESVANPAELNLKIEKVEIIQVTQDEIGSVPMVANRKALVRVYGLADQCNTATPNVSLTLSTAAGAKVLAAPEQSVRYHTEVGTLHSTWNYTTEASEIANGLTLVAEIDPGNAVQEANDSDNRYPASGSMAVTVRQVPVLGIRLVPVVNGQRTGSIQTDVIMELARKVHPVPGYDVTVRAPYTTSAGALTAQGGNWAEVLTEIDALRFADNSNRYYYGMLRVNFEDGVAGIAFVRNCTTPPPETKTDCKAAIGWDHPQTAAEVLAHEVGHNFERNHAPSSVCNQVPQQIDFTYPNTGLYAGGRIGQYGYDVETQQLKPPEHFNDVMGYCHNLWISDHMYRGMLNYVSDPNRAGTLPSIVSSGAGEPSLLIWGRIVGGTPVLEPAFEITTRPSLPPAGPHRLALLDERGAEIYGVSFAARVIGDLPGGGEGFAFAVPLSALRGRSPASMRLTARGRTVTTPRSGELSDDPGIVARRTAPDRVHLRWDATRFPVAMVRDARSGEVLSFARGGDATIAATRDDLEVSFSNRVRSARRTVPVRR